MTLLQCKNMNFTMLLRLLESKLVFFPTVKPAGKQIFFSFFFSNHQTMTSLDHRLDQFGPVWTHLTSLDSFDQFGPTSLQVHLMNFHLVRERVAVERDNSHGEEGMKEGGSLRWKWQACRNVTALRRREGQSYRLTRGPSRSHHGCLYKGLFCCEN